MSTQNDFDWLEQMRFAEDEARCVSRSLGRIADAFDETGNQLLADKLAAMQERLHTVASVISKATSGKVHEDFLDSQRMAGSLLSAVVHGVIRPLEKSA